MSHTQWFKAKRPDGSVIAVGKTTTVIRAGTLDEPNATISGLPRYHLQDGSAVNRLGEGRFQIVATGEELLVET